MSVTKNSKRKDYQYGDTNISSVGVIYRATQQGAIDCHPRLHNNYRRKVPHLHFLQRHRGANQSCIAQSRVRVTQVLRRISCIHRKRLCDTLTPDCRRQLQDCRAIIQLDFQPLAVQRSHLQRASGCALIHHGCSRQLRVFRTRYPCMTL